MKQSQKKRKAALIAINGGVHLPDLRRRLRIDQFTEHNLRELILIVAIDGAIAAWIVNIAKEVKQKCRTGRPA